MLKSKKASLELSIRAIVIVVLAMTLLGLGLGFIRSMFSDIGILSSSTFDKIKDQLNSELITSSEKLVFSQAKINLDRGKSSLLGWGIKNENSRLLEYWPEFKAIKCPLDSCPDTFELNNQWFTFKYNPGSEYLAYNYNPYGEFYSLNAADRHVKRVDLSIPRDATPGLYLIELSVYEKLPEGANLANARNDIYASTEIFLTVS